MLIEFVQSNLFTTAIVGLLFIIAWIALKTTTPRGIPPGPTPLPIIGNILKLRGDIRDAFKKLRSQYGDVFSFYMGDKLTVVFNGYETIKEAFVKNADVFCDRPHMTNFLPEHLQKSVGIVRANGEVWKKNRRFALTALRDFGMGKNVLQVKIQEEVTVLIEAIEDQKGEAFDIKELTHNAVSNIICSIVFGKRFNYDDEVFQSYLKCISENISAGGAGSVLRRFTIFRHWPGSARKEKQLDMKFIPILDFIEGIIEERLESYDENNIRSLIDAYIKEEKLNTKTLSSHDIYGLDLPRIVSDLFFAGTETTATSLLWTFLYYLSYPEVQQKAYAEIVDAIGTERLPGLEDRMNIPYLEATIMEILRHADIAPLTVPHATREDTYFRDFYIPKGTMTLMNLHSVMRDEHLWTKPEEFNPNRFLDQGSLKKFDHFIPFGIGKRACLGESLARMELTIFLGALTKNFKFLPAEGEEPPPLEGKLGATFAPNRYLIRAIKRL